MLRVTADVFSGRTNPAWVIDSAGARTALSALSDARHLLADDVPAGAGLGFRGLWIEALGDDATGGLPGPGRAYLPVGPQALGSSAPDLATRLIELTSAAEPAPGVAGDAAADTSLRDALAQQLELATRTLPTTQATVDDGPDLGGAPASHAATEGDATAAATCFIELNAFSPGFWNDNSTIRYNNNCYNYASNWRTDTFAQPGLGCGSMYGALTCDEVTRAALCDGMHRRYDCFPDPERPRYLVALVVAPGFDFHWYRRAREGFWGHKPGGTEARNVDNSGLVIWDPLLADRGPYTEFCGFFYGCNSQRHRIR